MWLPPSPPLFFEPFQGLPFAPPGYWQNSGIPGDAARFGARCPASSLERKGASALSVELPWHLGLLEYHPPLPLQSMPRTCAASLRHCDRVALRPKVDSSRGGHAEGSPHRRARNRTGPLDFPLHGLRRIAGDEIGQWQQDIWCWR